MREGTITGAVGEATAAAGDKSSEELVVETKGMDDSDLRESTIVILRPYDWNGAFKGFSGVARKMREGGANVVEIGNGREYLSLDYVEAALKKIEGPAVLFIAAHGGDAQEYGEHSYGGFTQGEELKTKFNKHACGFDAFDLFGSLPSNYKAVYSDSCYGGDGHEVAVTHLPQGTLFFPFAAADKVGFGSGTGFRAFTNDAGDWEERYIREGDLEGKFSGFIFEGKQKIEPAELFYCFNHFTMVTSGTRDYNISSRVSIGGIGTFDLRDEMELIDMDSLPDSEIKAFAEKYSTLFKEESFYDAYYPKKGRAYFDDPDNFDDLSIEEFKEKMKLTFSKVLADKSEYKLSGSADYKDESYVLAMAFSFEHFKNHRLNCYAHEALKSQYPERSFPENNPADNFLKLD